MSVRRVDTGPPVGSVAGVAGVLPPLQNLRAVPTGANNGPKADFRKTPFRLRFGFGKMTGAPEVFDRLKNKTKNRPGAEDLYVWLKVSLPADATTRRKIVGAISKQLASRMLEFNAETLGSVADTKFDSVYEKSCSGVYETTHAFHTYEVQQVEAMEAMVGGNLDTFIRQLMGSDSNGTPVTIGGNEYTYTQVERDVALHQPRQGASFLSEVEYAFSK